MCDCEQKSCSLVLFQAMLLELLQTRSPLLGDLNNDHISCHPGTNSSASVTMQYVLNRHQVIVANAAQGDSIAMFHLGCPLASKGREPKIRYRPTSFADLSILLLQLVGTSSTTRISHCRPNPPLRGNHCRTTADWQCSRARAGPLQHSDPAIELQLVLQMLDSRL